MMRMLLVMMSCGALILLAGCSSEDDSGMSFDDLAQLEQSEQGELLAMAEQAAGNWSFGSASDYLSQAEEKAYDPDAIGATKRVIRRAREAYQENERRKEEQRRQEEQRRLAAAARQHQNSSSGGNPDFVMVNVSSVGMFGVDKLTLSGGSGNFSGNGESNTASIMKGYNGSLGGRYDYTVRVYYRKYCSGSFSVSGRKANVLLQITGDCRLTSVSES